MKSAVLVDSSVFIGLLRLGRDPGVELLRKAEVLSLVTCGMVRLEVLRGILTPPIHASLVRFMSFMQNVPTDHRLWEDAAKLGSELGQEGINLPAPDIIIATCALRVSAAVLTYDKHFDMIPGLTVFHSIDELY